MLDRPDLKLIIAPNFMDKETPPPASASLSSVLSELPPGNLYRTLDTDFPLKMINGTRYIMMRVPTLKVFCDNQDCMKPTFFDHPKKNDYNITYEMDDCFNGSIFLDYCCRHCGKNSRWYSLFFEKRGTAGTLKVVKLGEFPTFAPHTPSKLFGLIGPDREYFLKGRRAESLNLGIAAFSYYRRVVERQKDRLFDQLIKVAETVESPPDLISGLRASRSEKQFHKAITQIHPAVPEALLLKGHNPLTLLHSALSEGLHSESDEECLELAQTIRIILAHFSEKIAAVMEDHKDLDEALSRLLKKQEEKKSKAKASHSANPPAKDPEL